MYSIIHTSNKVSECVLSKLVLKPFSVVYVVGQEIITAVNYHSCKLHCR